MKILHIAESAQGGVGTYLTEILSDQARRFGEANVRALVPAQHAAHLSGVDRRLLVTWQRREAVRVQYPEAGGGDPAADRAVRADGRPCPFQRRGRRPAADVRMGKHPPFRIVYCPHGWAFDRSSSGMKRRLIERIERDLAPRADRIVLISEHELREGLRIGIAAERMTLVLNGIADLHSDRPARWVDERVRVLFVGRLDTQRGSTPCLTQSP
ncbi:glycosyltransferase [Sphingomonas sp. I4]